MRCIRRTILTTLTISSMVGLMNPTATKAQQIQEFINEEAFILAWLDPRWNLQSFNEDDSVALSFDYQGAPHVSQLFYLRRAYDYGYAIVTSAFSGSYNLFYIFVFFVHDSGHTWVGRFGLAFSFEDTHRAMQAASCLNNSEGDYCGTIGSGKIVAYDGTLPFGPEKPDPTQPTSWGTIKASVPKP